MGFGRRPDGHRSREVRDVTGPTGVAVVYRCTGVVDDVVDRAGAEVHRHDVVQPHAGCDRHLEPARGVDRGVDVGEDVRPAARELVGLDVISDLVRGPAGDAVVLPGGLVGRVIGQFVLEEHGAAVLAVPDHVVLLVVLDEQAGRGDVVAVDDHAVAARVHIPADRAGDAVVGTPGPEVVDQDVVAVDLQGHGGLPDVRPADAEVHVADRRRVERIALPTGIAPIPGPDTQQHRGAPLAGVDRDPRDDHARPVGDGERHGAIDG